MDYSFGLYRIQPTQGADYRASTHGPASPDAVGGRLQVATFNVLNYFTTLDYPFGDPLDNKCGPSGNPRVPGAGADEPDEFTRQRDKIISAIAEIDADVVGLIEIENNMRLTARRPTSWPVSTQRSARGRTTTLRPARSEPTPSARGVHLQAGVSDAVRRLRGARDSSVDPLFDDSRNRPVLAQTFEENRQRRSSAPSPSITSSRRGRPAALVMTARRLGQLQRDPDPGGDCAGRLAGDPTRPAAVTATS